MSKWINGEHAMNTISKITGFASTVLLLFATSTAIQADDTEIFFANSSERQKVLIIFDNSGSMGRAVDGSSNPPQGASRIEIAQGAVTKLIGDNPGVDFGLMTFNNNQGGRVIQRLIDDMSETQRDDLKTRVEGLDASGFTPLCETLFEASRYTAGGDVLYGLLDNDRDKQAESGDGIH